MKLFLIFVLCVGLASAWSLKDWTRRVRAKAAHFIKGTPVSVSLIDDVDPTASKFQKVRGWLSRLRGSLRRAKTKITRKDIIEEEEGSGEPAFDELLNPLVMKEGNETEELSSDVLSHVSHADLHMFERQHHRCMIWIIINGVGHKMKFDTGSPWSMVPQRGCIRNPATLTLGTGRHVYTPPPNVPDSAVPDASPGRYKGQHAGAQRPGWRGKLRNELVLVAGTNIAFQGNFASATRLDHMPFAIMGAAPREEDSSLVYQLLRATGERFEFTTMFQEPSNPTRGAMNGRVVFGGTNRNFCQRDVAWMEPQSSDGTHTKSWAVQFSEVNMGGQQIDNSDHWATADSGTVSMLFQTDIYNRLLARFRQIIGAMTLNHPQHPSRQIFRCSLAQPFTFSVRVCGQHNNHRTNTICHYAYLRSHDLYTRIDDVPNAAQPYCELLIKDGGTRKNRFGFPFYKAICITHDIQNLRLGFAPYRPGATL